ncbi:hypothetical protein MPTK2_4g90130P [Marchantia polymorpha subsp. ruderalis]
MASSSASARHLRMAFSRKAVTMLLLTTLAFRHSQASSKGATITERIQHGFTEVTTTAEKLKISAEKIDIFSAPQQGIIIAQGLAAITEKVGHGIEKMTHETLPALPNADAEVVVDSLKEFVKAHQAMLRVLMEKNELPSIIASFDHIKMTLVNMEVAFELFAFDLIALIPTSRREAEKQFADLHDILKDTLTKYSVPFRSAESDAALTATTEKIIEGLKTVTEMSDQLRVATNKINIFNAPQQGAVIASGFTTIIQKVSEGIVRVDRVTSGPLPDADAQLVVDALTTFVQVHQALLNVVIGKHGILTMIPFFEPIRRALVSLEAVIDRLAFDLIALIPTQKSSATIQFQKLDVTLKDAEDTYSFPLASAESDAALTATTEKIVEGLKTVTDMSDQLRVATQKINIFNAPQQGAVIASGFATIIQKVSEGIIRVDRVTSGPLPDADAQLVVDALTTFVQVHQALLNVVIGKHGILTMIPFFEPIRRALVSLEAVIDRLAFDLIALIPTQKSSATIQFQKLDVTLKDAEDTYSFPLASAESDAALTATTEKIVEGLKTVTDMSDQLRVATQKINIFNAPQQGAVIASGFATIIQKVSEGIIRVDRVTSGPLPDADAQLVVDALTTFVQVHQALLNVVIGKHGIITMIPFFEPIRYALVSLEAVIDRLAFDLIALIPTQKSSATIQFQKLDVTLKDAEDTYSFPLGSAESDAALTATTEKIVEGLKTVTDMSDQLRVATQKINIFNAPQQGAVIASGFATIIQKVSEGIIRVDRVTSGPLPDADAQLVVDALTTFVQVHQALLNVVIGKHGIITMIPFFEPIRYALVSLEAVIDRLAFDLIALIPTQKSSATIQFQKLDVTLKDAEDTYSFPLASAESDAALTATIEKIVEGLKTVTDMSDQLRVATQKINIFNAPQQGAVIASGFATIIQKVSEGIIRVDRVTSGPLPDADAQLVVDALTTFVQVHQALLNVVIGKHGIITMIPFFEPIRYALVSLEAVIDRLAFDLIALIPTQKSSATIQFQKLDVTLKDAEDTYSFPLGSAESDAALTATTEKIVEGLKAVSDMSDQLRVATQKINIFNAPQQGAVIASGFATLIQKVSEGIVRVDRVTSGPLPDADAQVVVDALTTFVQVHQALLNVVIGKHGILTMIPFFEPIRMALVSLEAVIDRLAFDLIALIPTQKSSATIQFQKLDVTLKDAEDTYSFPLASKTDAQSESLRKEVIQDTKKSSKSYLEI